MSLKVWLPLDGDLRNLGTSNGNFSIKTALTYTDNGKIGKAYSGGAITIDANTTASILNNQEFSFTCWVYVNSTEGNTSNREMFFGNSSMGENNNRKFSIFQYPTCNDLHLSWMNDTASTTFIGGVWAGVFPSYKWTHIAVTYKNPNCTIYVNGAKYDTRTGTSSSSSFEYETYLFYNAPNQTRYLNDYRIYDHCLSAAEVHEIAQGLILHYKLDNNGWGNENLATGTSTAITLIPSGGNDWFAPVGFYPNDENGLNLLHNSTDSDLFTVSFDYTATGVESAFEIRPSLKYTSTSYTKPNYTKIASTAYLSIGSSSGHFEGTFYTTPGQREYGQAWLLAGATTSTTVNRNIQLIIKNFKFEQGSKSTPWCPNKNDTIANTLGYNDNQIHDCSGYNHFATTPSALATTSDTPRYSTATTFDGTNYGYIQSTVVESDHLSSEYTWAGWIYRDYTDATARYLYNGITKVYLDTDFSTRIQWNHGKSDGTASVNTSDMGIIIPYKEWTHLVWTFKDGYLKIYINGEYKDYSNRTGTGQFIKGYTNQMIGANTSSSGQWIGSISDIRIYTTALLDNDIKLLYNMGMKVDNLGGVHGFELNETQSNVFRSELIMPFAKSNNSAGIGEIVLRNNEYAMDLRPEPFYHNLSDTQSGVLQGYFRPGSYIIDIWIDADENIYNGNYYECGIYIIYTDESSSGLYATGGDKGWQHMRTITPADKTIDRIMFRYYDSKPTYYRLDSYMCYIGNVKLEKVGQLNTSNFVETSNVASITKGGSVLTTEFIEI